MIGLHRHRNGKGRNPHGMEIGIVAPYFYPWYGGITEHVYYQYRELTERGHNVKVITPFDGMNMVDPAHIIKLGRPVPFLSNGSVTRVPLVADKRRRVREILERGRFDLLHLHQPLFCFLGLAFMRRIRELQRDDLSHPLMVGTFHACGGPSAQFLMNTLGSYFHRFRPVLDYKIAVSPASMNFVKRVLPGHYEIIPNGVDVERFSSAGETIAGFDDGVHNILFVGRLEPRKGVLALLESLPLVPAFTDKPFRLLIVGNGIFLKHYLGKVPAPVRDRVFFLGEVSFQDLPKYYRTAHLFCSPASYGESFGIVLIEAMAAGLPIIAGDNEGYRTVIQHGVNGLLVDGENPRDIARNIARLLDNERERRRLAVRSKEIARAYEWPSIFRRIDDIYRTLADTRISRKRASLAV